MNFVFTLSFIERTCAKKGFFPLRSGKGRIRGNTTERKRTKKEPFPEEKGRIKGLVWVGVRTDSCGYKNSRH